MPISRSDEPALNYGRLRAFYTPITVRIFANRARSGSARPLICPLLADLGRSSVSTNDIGCQIKSVFRRRWPALRLDCRAVKCPCARLPNACDGGYEGAQTQVRETTKSGAGYHTCGNWGKHLFRRVRCENIGARPEAPRTENPREPP